MKIKILEERIHQAPLKHVNIIISDGETHYQLEVGGLPLIGDLQQIQQLLKAREETLWLEAQIENNLLTTREVRRACYNSPTAGGWTSDEFQEAHNENFGGKSNKLRRIKALRDVIREEWSTD